MKKELLLYRILVLVLITLNAFLLYKHTCNKDTRVDDAYADDDRNTYDSTLFHDIYDAAMISNGIKVDKNLTFISSTDKKITLNEIMKTTSLILVFDFNHINCKTCFEDEMLRIIDVSKEIGQNKVIFVSEFENQREQYVLEKKYGIKILSIGNNQFGLPIENEYYPFVFTIDSSFIAKDVYIPTKEFFSMGDIYYNIVYNKYFSGK